MFLLVESMSGRSIGCRQIGNNIWVARLAQDIGSGKQTHNRDGLLASEQTQQLLRLPRASLLQLRGSALQLQLRGEHQESGNFSGVKVSLFGFHSIVSEHAKCPQESPCGLGLFIYKLPLPLGVIVEPAGKKHRYSNISWSKIHQVSPRRAKCLIVISCHSLRECRLSLRARNHVLVTSSSRVPSSKSLRARHLFIYK